MRAITHSSTTTHTYTVAEDHIKNALSNGGLRWYKRLETAQVPKKMKALLAELERGRDTSADEGQRLQNNEQLEYLGDALLEYLCRYIHVHVRACRQCLIVMWDLLIQHLVIL